MRHNPAPVHLRHVLTALALLFAACGAAAAAGSLHYAHRTNPANTTFNTALNNSLGNHNRAALFFVTPNYNPGNVFGGYHDRHIGVYYDPYVSNKWGVFNQDGSAVPANGIGFNVVGHTPGGPVFTHQATVANTFGNYTLINHPHANRNPGAILLVTPNFNPGGAYGVHNNHAVGVFFDAYNQRWAIFNQDHEALPVGASFNVQVLDPSPADFVHRATPANSLGNYTMIDHPQANDNPHAVLLVTANWNPGGGAAGIYNDHAIGVWYTGARWAIFNQDLAAMSEGAAFNVQLLRPKRNRIAFVSYRDGNSEIYAMNADGTAQTRLTYDLGTDKRPAWSPDGTKIAFETRPVSGEPEQIYVMNANGSDLRRLTNVRPEGDPSIVSEKPAWSPDGTQLAFEGLQPLALGNDAIYVINADGSGQRSLNRSEFRRVYGLGHDWSPDGTRIAVAWNEIESLGNEGIYVNNIADGTETRLTDLQMTQNPRWSPDGTKIAFIGEWRQEVHVMNADGSGQTRLTNNSASEIAWSPDGTKIVFTSTLDYNGEIYVMNADGSGQLRLTNHHARDTAPAWSPDGTRIAFQSDRDGNPEIYVMNADGSGQMRLTTTAQLDLFPVW